MAKLRGACLYHRHRRAIRHSHNPCSNKASSAQEGRTTCRAIARPNKDRSLTFSSGPPILCVYSFICVMEVEKTMMETSQISMGLSFSISELMRPSIQQDLPASNLLKLTARSDAYFSARLAQSMIKSGNQAKVLQNWITVTF